MQSRKRNRNDDELPAEQRDVIVILEKAGLMLGRDGLVDAYDRAASTEVANESLAEVRPDIVHQCLLALFDSDLAFRRRLRVYISTIKGKTIEVSTSLRPPRTYGRFKGLMCALLRDGSINSVDGQQLLRILPGSVAPVIPHGAKVTGLCNSNQAPVRTASELARLARASPVDNALQGGAKNAVGFFCISCTDDQSMDGIDYITDYACVSVYPASSHVLCARLCEGFARALGPVRRDVAVEGASADPTTSASSLQDSRPARRPFQPSPLSATSVRGRGGDRGEGFRGRGDNFRGRGGDGFRGRGGDGFRGRGGEGFRGRGGDSFRGRARGASFDRRV